MRAVVEHHGVESELPNLEVTVARGKEDLSIRVSFSIFAIYTIL
jgi:hypothetical protein